MSDLVAYDVDHLRDILNSNGSCRNFSEVEVKRIASLGEQRTQDRIDGPMDDEQNDHVLTTDWHGFAKSEFGEDETVNDVVLGLPNETLSADKDAMLFEEAVIVQSGWLSSGDGRRTKIDKYVSDDYDDATPGSLWIPRSALDYFVVVKLGNEMVREQARLSDAM